MLWRCRGQPRGSRLWRLGWHCHLPWPGPRPSPCQMQRSARTSGFCGLCPFRPWDGRACLPGISSIFLGSTVWWPRMWLRSRAAWIRTPARNLDAWGPLCFSALTSVVGTAAGPASTRLTQIPFPSACVGSGPGARAGTGWLPCAAVGHAVKACRLGKRRGRLGSNPAPSPSSAVTLGKLLGLSVPQCHLFSGDDNSDVSLRLLSPS